MVSFKKRRLYPLDDFFSPGLRCFTVNCHAIASTRQGLLMREGEPGSVDLGLECKEHDMEVD